MLKGAKGTVVKITISREGYTEPLVFTVTRDEIPRHSVDIAFLLRPGIGYIRLSGFNETTDREIADALKQLNAPSLDGLILDMRGNPGGLLNEAVAVGDMFLDKNQLIVSHHGRASTERRYYAIRGNQGDNVPLVILVNGNSASATESFLAPCKTMIGPHRRETTFGKAWCKPSRHSAKTPASRLPPRVTTRPAAVSFSAITNPSRFTNITTSAKFPSIQRKSG